MNNILETPRLYLREFRLKDAEDFYQLNEDPEVVRYTGDRPFKNVEEALHFLKGYTHYCQYGFGRWAVIRREDEGWLGWCGLKYTPGLDEVDLGFRFFRKYWGQGYATETAKACLNYGMQELKLTEIVGRAMKANKASIRVMEKIGMLYWKDFDFEGEPGVYYKRSL
jgi:ribosomal-protein-alanine N-acetyltransferase